jgi:ABC-2 type transport system permease protein
VPYLAFLAPGIIAQSALFISIFYGIQIIWDRDAGILAKLMVTPAPASALVTGKAFAAGVRSVAQVVGVLVLAYLMGIHMTWNPLRILAAMGVVMLGSAFFACLSMTLAGLVRNRDRLMGIGQAITMPLFFASNALYPVAVMPDWLRWLSRVNPLSYEVDWPDDRYGRVAGRRLRRTRRCRRHRHPGCILGSRASGQVSQPAGRPGRPRG